jgi:hypothetical protein
MYLHCCGLGKGYAWCSAFVKWCLTECGVDTRTITAWAATTYNYSKVVYARGRIVQQPQPGDVFQLWDYRYARVAHTGFYHSRVTDDIYESVEGNTNGGGSADGDGVYRRKRSLKATYALTRWL